MAVLPGVRAYNDAGGINKALPYALASRYLSWDESKSKVDLGNGRALGALGGIIAGAVAHKVASKLGVNKWLRTATFGWIEI
jgi:hypothetical protein